jgi:hypothetical protein
MTTTSRRGDDEDDRDVAQPLQRRLVGAAQDVEAPDDQPQDSNVPTPARIA